MIYSDNTFDITNNIDTYTRRDFKSVFDTTSNKWYMLNNLNAYEEYGIYGDSLSGTYYPGKLVIVNDHEYEWDGTKWDDLGTSIAYPYIQFPDSTATSNAPKFETSVYLKNTYTLKFKIKTPANNGRYNRMILGAFSAQGNLNSNHFAVWTQNTNTPINFTVGWWNYGTGQAMFTEPAFTLQPNTEYVFEMQVGTGVTKINGVVQDTSGGNNIEGTLSAPMLIGMLQYNNPGWNGAIYYVKVLEGDTLIANYEATNSNNTLGYYDSVSETKITNTGGGTPTYGEDGHRPKDYADKVAPTITSLWGSRIFRNSNRLYKLLKNEDEQAIWNYKSEILINKA